MLTSPIVTVIVEDTRLSAPLLKTLTIESIIFCGSISMVDAHFTISESLWKVSVSHFWTNGISSSTFFTTFTRVLPSSGATISTTTRIASTTRTMEKIRLTGLANFAAARPLLFSFSFAFPKTCRSINAIGTFSTNAIAPPNTNGRRSPHTIFTYFSTTSRFCTPRYRSTEKAISHLIFFIFSLFSSTIFNLLLSFSVHFCSAYLTTKSTFWPVIPFFFPPLLIQRVTVPSVTSNTLRDAKESCFAWFRAAILWFSVNFIDTFPR